jgi:hypothetical protein
VEEASAENLANYTINNGVIIEQANQHGIIKSQVFLTVSPMAGGSYELTIQGVEDLVGNAMSSTVVPFTSTGIDDPSAGAKLSVYPNPSNGKFSIEWNGEKQENVIVSLFTVTGMKVWSGQFNSFSGKIFTIDARGISSGQYFIELRSNDTSIRHKLLIR